MPTSVVKLVALILIAAQAWFVVAPGRMLCIPVGACEEHRETAPIESVQATRCGSSCGHHHHTHAVEESSDPAPVKSQHHDHGPLVLMDHEHPDCGCHLHIPIPDDEKLPAPLRNGELFGVQVIAAPALLAILDWDFEPVTERLGRPPEVAARDQTLGLKTTRLRL